MPACSRSMARSSPAPDLVVMVTDGNPTLNNTTNTSASEVNWEDFTQAVTSANLLKSNDSRVITVAAGAAGSISIPGLIGISGPLTNQPSALDDDYIIGTPAELADALRDLALARCGASLDIEKQSVGGTATFDFSGTGAGLPATFTRDTAAANPTTNAPFAFTAPQFGTKYVQETPEPGWTLTNIACTANGAVITIGTGSGAGFAQGATAGFDPGDTTVRAVIDASDAPACTFTNSPGLARHREAERRRHRDLRLRRQRHGPRALHPEHRGCQPHGQRAVHVHRPPVRDQGRPGDARARRLDADEHRVRRQRRGHHDRHGHRRRLRVARRRGLQRRRHHRAGGHRGREHPDLHVHEHRGRLARRREAERGRHRDLRLRRHGRRPPGHLHPRYRGRQPHGQRALHLHRRPVRDQGRPGDARGRLDAQRTSCAPPTARSSPSAPAAARASPRAPRPGFDPGDTTVRAVIAAGNTPTCTFTNSLNASLDIEKQSVGGTATFDYAVNGAGLAPFTRDTAVSNPTANAPFTFAAAQFGTKDVQETPVPAGWTLTNIVCAANGAVMTIGTGIGGTFAQGATAGFDPGDTTVRAAIDAGDTPTCTFTNSRDASLDIEKQSVGGTATFDFTGTGAGLPATFTRDTAAANPTTNAPFTFAAAQFGTKDVVETPEAGWTLTNIACTANGAVITIGTGSGAGFAQGATRRLRPGRHHRAGGPRGREHPDLHVHEHRGRHHHGHQGRRA